eukprot:95931-Pelagomonas_calceolata.AAC.2
MKCSEAGQHVAGPHQPTANTKAQTQRREVCCCVAEKIKYSLDTQLLPQGRLCKRKITRSTNCTQKDTHPPKTQFPHSKYELSV